MVARAERLARVLLTLPPRSADRAVLAGVAAVTSLKLLALAINPLDLSPDEAHYWHWSRRLDWAYYSKGPVIALLVAASTSLLGDTDLAVRLPAMAISAAFYLVGYAFLRRLAPPGVALLALGVLASGPFFGSLGLAMTDDPPALLGWVIGLLCAFEAVARRSPRLWIGAGVAFGVAALSKYTAAIVYPSLGLFLAGFASAGTRRLHLASTGFWGGAAAFLLCLTPVVLWDARHGGVNLAHNLAHVVTQEPPSLRVGHVLELLGAQFLLVGPIAAPLFAWAGWRGWRRLRDAADDRAGVLLSAAVPLALLCAAVALTRRTYPNWSMPIAVHLAALFAYLTANDRAAPRLWRPLAGAALASNAALLLAFCIALVPIAFGWTFGVDPNALITRKLAGWETLGARVESLLDEAERGGRPLSFVMTHFASASSVAFYTPRHPEVLTADRADRRMTQYDVWAGWSAEQGRDGLLVLRRPDVPSDIARRFREVSRIAEPLDICYGGATVRTYHFFRGTGLSGEAPPPAPRF